MKILMPYAYGTLGSFAQQDLETLRATHEVEVVLCDSSRGTLIAALRAARADLLFCWFASLRYLPAMLVARLFGRPVVVVTGGYDVANEPDIAYGNMRPGLTRLLGRLAFRLATRVLAFSKSGAADAERHAGVNPARMRVLYLGVDDRGSTAPMSKDALVLTVAHLNESSIVRKGILTMVRAARLVPEAQFIVAGEGDENTMALLRAESGPNVRLAGRVSDAERDDLMRRAAVYCQVSVHEGFGLAVAEAMLMDAVPVVSRRGSLPEVVGPTGLYVEPGNAEELAQAVRAVLTGAARGTESPREFVQRNFSLRVRQERLRAAVEALRERGHQ